MITHLRGQLSELNPTTAVIDCGGVGYEVHISLTTYSHLQGQQGEVKLLTTPIIRADAHLLYGFASGSERELFGLLIGVSGVGPGTARLILSQYAPSELSSILALGQVDPLKAVKGIGLKTAQRIILELKGKLQLENLTDSPTTAGGASPLSNASQTQEEAISALKMLGYPEAAAGKVVRQLLSSDPLLPVEQLIRQALVML